MLWDPSLAYQIDLLNSLAESAAFLVASAVSADQPLSFIRTIADAQASRS
jgi:hypothetical protein